MTTTKKPIQIVPFASPIKFFSRLHAIEECVSNETIHMLRFRHWKGPLTANDWQLAEDLVLEKVTATSSLRTDGFTCRVSATAYSADDISIHLEGDLLCICGCRTDEEDHQKMFSVKVKLPGGVVAYRSVAWVSPAGINIAFSAGSIPKPAAVAPTQCEYPVRSTTLAATACAVG